MKTKNKNLCEYLFSMTLDQLDELCDDPERDQPGGNEVRAILTYDSRNGFYLSAQDGQRVYTIVEKDGEPVRFRTIEQAIEVLQDLPLASDIRLDLAAPAGR